MGDFEKKYPARMLVPREIHEHEHCQKKKNKSFSEPKKGLHVIEKKDAMRTHILSKKISSTRKVKCPTPYYSVNLIIVVLCLPVT